MIHMSCLTAATVLYADPKDVAVEANEWATFSCTAHCDYSVNWYMAGHPIALKRNDSVPGLLLKKSPASRCNLNRRTHFFKLRATETFNSSTFYCAAFEKGQGDNCRCGTGGKCYSRPALLTGMSAWNADVEVFVSLVHSVLEMYGPLPTTFKS